MTKTAKIIKLNKEEFPRIERGIPLSSARSKADRWKFSLSMQVDDSFFLDFKRYSKGAAGLFRHFIAEHKPNWKITTRTTDEGVRVWRVK